MDAIEHLNLLHFFNFYLGLMFLIGIAIRWRMYHSVFTLVRNVPGRWPRLLKLISNYRHILLTWPMIWPTLLALGLFAINFVATRYFWPGATLTTEELPGHWLVLPMIAFLGAAMLAVDAYATFAVGSIDRALLEKYFDQAEYWLKSWTAPVVRAFTFGYINPRKIVAKEVEKALELACQLMTSSQRTVILQTALRIAFGSMLWFTWAWNL